MAANQLNEILESARSLTFELALGAGAMLLLAISIVNKNVILSKIVFVVVLLASLWLVPLNLQEVKLFGASLVFDSLGVVVKWLFGFSSIWIVFFPNSKKHPPEFYFLILTILLGSSLMLSANHLLVVYLVVELTSFGAYIVTNFNFQKQSFEAGMKYLVFGGVSSALALYGASLIYGFTGALSFDLMNLQTIDQPILLNAGIFLFLGSLLFKVSIVPFHAWAPGTYQEAPTDAVLILSVVPKIGGFVLLHRVAGHLCLQDAYWLYLLLVVLGSFTVIFGALGAIGQANIKRLISYGAISHSGYLLAAVLVPFQEGSVAFLWYAAIYAVTNLAVFYFISVFEENGQTELFDISGLYRTEGYLALLLVIPIVALIGLPPTAGFTAKFYLFTVMWDSYQKLGDPAILGYLAALILAVPILLFIYLKIPYYIFFKETIDTKYQKSTFWQKIVATIFPMALLLIFFIPGTLNKIAEIFKAINW